MRTLCCGLLTLVLAWATGCRGSRDEMPPAGETAPAVSETARRSLDRALDAYEEIRHLLATDSITGIPETSGTLATAAGQAALDLATTPRLEQAARKAAETASHLAHAPDLEAARTAFSPLSQAMVTLVQSVPELRANRYLFECPMVTTGFNRWVQVSAEIENPYMGSRMPRCGSLVAWPETAEGASDAGAGSEVAYYTCPMHPFIQKAVPGTCPICAMDLVPVTREEIETGVILVDAARRQKIGVRTAQVEVRPLARTIHAAGRVVMDETGLTDVTLKVSGYIGRLVADETGQRVRKGDPLFTLYSPEIYAAEQEYLTALAAQLAAAGTSAPDRANDLVDAARRRLQLLDLTDTQIAEIAVLERPLEYVHILSPASGVIVEKDIVEGAAVTAGMRLFRIADLDRVWVEAQLYDEELSAVGKGLPAQVTLPYVPGAVFPGRVAFIYPTLNGESRTGRIRIELENADGQLRPDMVASVDLYVDLGPRLAVPESAVIYAGRRNVVFVDLGEGRLRPQDVTLGQKSDDWVEVLSGVREGDVVVSSGNFLIAAESRLKSAGERWQ